MKFSIGDKVIFKHTDGEGIVTAFINNDMLEVEIDGVSFPIHIDEIEHPYLKWFTEKKIQRVPKSSSTPPEQLPVEKQKLRKPRLAQGIYLSYMPEYKLEEMEDVVDILKIYLLNETPKNIQFRYEMTLKNESVFSHEGKLHPFGHVYLHSIPYEQMNDQPRFRWWLDDMEDADMAPANDVLRIRPQKLFQHIDHCLSNNDPSFNYLLIEDFKPTITTIEPPISKQQPKSATTHKKATPKETPVNLGEIDLHIEELVSSTRGMSNADIIQIQQSALQAHLRMVINAHQERLIIIHGLGTGKLKEEVHELLNNTYGVKSYSNEWQARYGFGATEVWFEY